MYIKNITQLLSKDLDETQLYLRKIGLKVLENALTAVKAENIINSNIRIQNKNLIIQQDKYDLSNLNRIIIIGGGKATAEMSFALENILKSIPQQEYGGLINIPDNLDLDSSNLTSRIVLNYASHPIPNEMGFSGTTKMIDLIKQSSKNDLVICLISGGGSALLPLPKNGVNLKDLQEINSLLLASGATIHEINTIRKHLSDFKGGNLAKIVFELSGATLISLIISDVVGDNLDIIASGPTVPDLSTYQDAVEILKKYNLYDKVPLAVRHTLNKGIKIKELETPKPNDKCFSNVHNYLIGSVNSAVQAVINNLNKLEFQTEYFSNEIVGEARDFGNYLFQMISNKIKTNMNKKYKIALIGTGELTVTIKGKGIGGRNQEMLLSFLDFVKDETLNNTFLIIAVNLDGIEGNSTAMGALIDNYILTQVVNNNINIKKYLNGNDSNSFFKLVEGEIITGPTGCNVNDLILVILQN
ncbi:MAG: glycerate kinase type-2 family protein [Promethearchaeota archaeon]